MASSEGSQKAGQSAGAVSRRRRRQASRPKVKRHVPLQLEVHDLQGDEPRNHFQEEQNVDLLQEILNKPPDLPELSRQERLRRYEEMDWDDQPVLRMSQEMLRQGALRREAMEDEWRKSEARRVAAIDWQEYGLSSKHALHANDAESDLPQSNMTINDLPDEMVAHILSYLEPAELLGTVRAVCRSWSQLALHWDAWRGSSLPSPDGSEGDKLLKKVLQLAPRIDMMSFYAHSLSHDMKSILASSNCAVNKLFIDLDVGPDAMRILRTQKLHTKYLSLFVYSRNPLEVLDFLQEMSVVELDLYFHYDWSLRWHVESFRFLRACRSESLKRLTVRLCSGLDPVIESLVMANRESLEEFHLRDQIARLPATMKALDTLRCKRLKVTVPAAAILDLIGLNNLSHLTVLVYGGRGMKEREGLLTLSHRLLTPKSLTIDLRMISTLDLGVGELVFDTLMELETCSRAWPLESLEIKADRRYAANNFPAHLARLLPVVKSLYYLKELRLPAVPTANALDGMVTSSLCLLDLGGSTCSASRNRSDGAPCCVPTLRRLVSRMPLLHVTGLQLHRCTSKCQSQGCSCLEAHGGELEAWGMERAALPCGVRARCQQGCDLCELYTPTVWGRWIIPN